MARRSPTLWLGLCAGSALLLVAVVLLLARHAKATRDVERTGAATTVGAHGPSTATAAACAIPVPSLRRAEPDAESPPVILWAVGQVHLFLDGKAAFSPPEAPKHFAPGEHELRIEAPGRAPVTTRIRLVPYQPALIHVEDDPAAGLTLIRIGAVCASCETPVTPFTRFPASKTKSKLAADALLAQAAESLRTDKWAEASVALGAVPAKARDGVLFHRLASATWAGAGDVDHARAEAARIRGPGANELDTLLSRLDALGAEEQQRYARVVLQRWNKVTEQHEALLRSAEGVADLDLATSERRMEELSAAFNAAIEKKSVPEEERVFVNAEAVTRALLDQLVAARRNDCALRAKVATALAGETP